MKKSDLKSGMRVTTRNKDQFIVMLNPACENADLIDFNEDSHMSLIAFEDDLTYEDDDDIQWDIVKVESPNIDICNLFYDKDSIPWSTIWRREEEVKAEEFKEVTMAEIEEKFGCKIKIVKGE